MINALTRKLEGIHPQHHRTFFIVGFLTAVLAIVVFFASWPASPNFSTDTLNGKTALDSTIKINFSWPVFRQIKVTISPSVDVEAKYDALLSQRKFATRATLDPAATWEPNTTYTVRVENVRRMLPIIRPRSYTFTFTTLATPNVTQIFPAVNTEIPANTKWQIALDRPADKFTEYFAQTEPLISTDISYSADKKTLTISPAQQLVQGKGYKLKVFSVQKRYVFGTDTVFATAEPKLIQEGDWQVRIPPEIKSVFPQGSNVSLDKPISIIFNETIPKQNFLDHISVSPEVGGTWQTNDEQTYTLQPTALSPATTYTVKVSGKLETTNHGFIVDDLSFQFRTVEPVNVLSSSPLANSKGVSVDIHPALTFNQNVDHQSAESNFSITPKINGKFSWSGEILTFLPEHSLNFGTSYVVSFAVGIQGEGGLPSTQTINLSFSTELGHSLLAVPFHKQEHNLSCEAATLFMALQYRGVKITEQQIINEVGFDTTKKQNGVWGNPYVSFVGDINGHQPSTGYGVYWQPIAKVAQKYRDARWFTGWSLADLLAETRKGNPVIIWGTAGSGTRIDWKTPQGQNVVAINGEHVYVVMGFIGTPENPTTIIVQDPLVGERYFTKAKFLWNWGLLGNSGVVIE